MMRSFMNSTAHKLLAGGDSNKLICDMMMGEQKKCIK